MGLWILTSWPTITSFSITGVIIFQGPWVDFTGSFALWFILRAVRRNFGLLPSDEGDDGDVVFARFREEFVVVSLYIKNLNYTGLSSTRSLRFFFYNLGDR